MTHAHMLIIKAYYGLAIYLTKLTFRMLKSVLISHLLKAFARKRDRGIVYFVYVSPGNLLRIRTVIFQPCFHIMVENKITIFFCAKVNIDVLCHVMSSGFFCTLNDANVSRWVYNCWRESRNRIFGNSGSLKRDMLRREETHRQFYIISDL